MFLLKIKRFRSLNYVRYHPVSNRLTIVKHPFEVYEVGLHHIAFYTDTRDQVDQACELAKRLGAKVLDGPGEFPYDPEGWYAVYFQGPDGLKLEVVHQPSAVKRYAEMMRIAEQLMKH